METTITINKDVEFDLSEVKKKIRELHDGEYIVTIKKKTKRRTELQNRSLHLYFSLLAEALNDAGFDMKKTIRNDLDIYWTDYNIKEFLWRPVQDALFGKKSTTQLTTAEIDKVYVLINKTIGERTGISIQWPSVENSIKY